MELLLQQMSLASRLRWHQDLMQSGVDLTKRQNNFIRCDVKVGREAAGIVGAIYLGWMILGLRQDEKKRLSIIALSWSEVDEAEPFDNVMEWLESLDFRARMMDQNF